MPETVRKNTTLAPTRRDALVGAMALPAAAIATSAALPSPLQFSSDFRELRSCAIEINRVMSDLDGLRHAGNPFGAMAGEVLLEGLYQRTARIIARINAKPVWTMSDLLDRAAVTLYWSDGGATAEAWPPNDPVEHLLNRGISDTENESALAAAQLAAAVFALARQGGANV